MTSAFKFNGRSLLLGLAVFLGATLLSGWALWFFGQGDGFLSVLAGGVVGIVGGIVSGIAFAMIQAAKEQQRLAQVFEVLTRGQYKRVELAEYPSGRPGAAKRVQAPIGRLITITHKEGTRMAHIEAEYGQGRGLVQADITFAHEPLRTATGRYRYVEGACVGHQGTYELHLWDEGRSLPVKYSAYIPHRGVDGYEIWEKS